MDLATLVKKVYELIAAIREKRYFVALNLALEIFRAISDAMPKPLRAALGKPTSRSQQSKVNAKSLKMLAADLRTLCRELPSGSDMKAAPKGPFIVLLLPILLAILKKLLDLFGQGKA